ncbi:MAG TPA: DUF2924 domain-containing protein [Falsiroseomonas sp.]|jgi:hypothetical protein|nr:DUF2924 domain-containing protein [Falsiroseomonas sp.]
MQGTSPGRGGADQRHLPLAEALKGLRALDAVALRSEWRRLYRAAAAVPSCFSHDLLLRGVAYGLQQAALGGLPTRVQRQLAAALSRTAGPQADATRAPPAVPRLRPGTTLVRQWHGRTHTVLVLSDGGFEHQGRRYASLSPIARAITGAHWSGPRFFGLTRAAAKPKAGQQAAAAATDA